MFRAVRLVKTIGIAIGSLTIAYLAVPLVTGLLFGQAAQSGALPGLAIVALGGLVFADIMRRQRPPSVERSQPSPTT